MKKLNLPSWLTVGLGVALGVLGALNVAAFNLGDPWSQLVTFACAAAASLGVAPLVHGTLRNALHLTYPLALSIAGALTTACAGITATKWDDTVKGIVIGVLTAAAGVLAGPDTSAPVPVPPSPSPEPVPVPVPPAPTPPTPDPAPAASRPRKASPGPKRTIRKSAEADHPEASDDSRA